MKILRTQDEINLGFHPYRVRILMKYYDLDRPMTVKQVATELGESPAKVHYHVKKLVNGDLLELIKTELINGITAKFYFPKYIGFDMTYDEFQKPENKMLRAHSEVIQFDYLSNRFKEALKYSINNVFDPKDFSEYDVGQVLPHLHMTKEEAKEFVDTVLELAGKYAKPKDAEVEEGKYKYLSLLTILRNSK